MCFAYRASTNIAYAKDFHAPTNIAMQMTAWNAGTSVAKKRAAVTSAGRRGCAAGATILQTTTLGALVRDGVAITLAPQIKVYTVAKIELLCCWY